MEDVKKELPKAGTFEGMSQYRLPLCYELVGKTFELVMDNGYDYELKFPDRKTLSFGLLGKEPNTFAYDCLKADDDTYFVNFEITGVKPRAGMSFVLDMEQSLVTAEYITQGENPKFPNLPKPEIIFGAIRREDGTIPEIRHGHTDEMVGKAIAWSYGTMRVVHVYSSEHYYRLTATPEDKARMQAANMPEPRVIASPDITYEEPSDYIKIKDGIYVFSMTESMMARKEDNHKGNNLLFVMNLNRMYDVGRSFGLNGDMQPENYTFSAYGEYFDASEELAKESTAFIR